MSIISDALKKVEGNSNASPAVREDPPESTTAGEERAVAGFAPAPSPPLFSVWSIVLSTAMVLIAAALLLVTWYTNRGRTISPATGSSTFAEVPAIDATLSAPAPPAPPAPVEMVEAPPPTVAEAPPAPTNPVVTPVVQTAPPGPPVSDIAEATEEPASVKAPANDVSEAQQDELVLTGVVFTPQLRMAHINGKILSEGAEIAGYRLVRISRESVRLSKDGKFYILQPKR